MVELAHHLTTNIREQIISIAVRVGVMQHLLVEHPALKVNVLMESFAMLMFHAIPMSHLMYLHNQCHLYQSIAEQVQLMQPRTVGNLAETIAIAASIRSAMPTSLRVLIPKTKEAITFSVARTFVVQATSAQSLVPLDLMQNAILGNDATQTRHATRM